MDWKRTHASQCRHCPQIPTFSFGLHTATQTRDDGNDYRSGCPRALFPPASPPRAFTPPQSECARTNSHGGSDNCLGPPQHRSCDPQGLGADQTPPPPHSPRGDAIYPSPINRAGSPWAKRQEGRPFSPTPPCVPQLLLGGCAPPAPPAPEDPLPSLRGPGGTPAAPLSPEGARSPRLPWRGEKKPPLRGAPSLRAP